MVEPERDPWQRTAGELAAAVRAGTLKATHVVEHFLQRIRALDEDYGAWLRLDEAGARAQAEAIDEKVARGEDPGPLAGVPVGIKDQIVTEGLETTCASRILEGWVPPYDATAVERLRAAGAVVVGKTNQDEFAMGSSCEHSAYHPCRNPWDRERVPGGSSGGSAAAVALGQAPVTLGTDTGGSIRQPASLCGVVGLKPTYGRVSRYGAVAFASSLDQIGPFGRCVEDVARVFDVVAGHDPLDSTSIATLLEPTLPHLDAGVEGLRLGLPRQYFQAEGMQEGVRKAVEQGIERLARAGATLVEIDLPHTEYCVATYYLVATAEASSNLARYDGVRYGRRAAASRADVHELYARTRAEGFGPEVIRRIMLGTYALSSGYYDAYYLKALKVRTLIRRDFEAAFEQVDAILTPTSPVVAFRIGEVRDDPLQMYLMDIFTISVNLAGVPAVSVPCGFSEGLPVGLQVIGKPLGEATVLRIARAHEAAWQDAGAVPPAALGTTAAQEATP